MARRLTDDERAARAAAREASRTIREAERAAARAFRAAEREAARVARLDERIAAAARRAERAAAVVERAAQRAAAAVDRSRAATGRAGERADLVAERAAARRDVARERAAQAAAKADALRAARRDHARERDNARRRAVRQERRAGLRPPPPPRPVQPPTPPPGKPGKRKPPGKIGAAPKKATSPRKDRTQPGKVFAGRDAATRLPGRVAALLVADKWDRTPRGSGVVASDLVVVRGDGSRTYLPVDDAALSDRADLVGRVERAARGEDVRVYLRVERAK